MAEALETPRLTLEPLRVAHADEVAAALGDPVLHGFIGGAPATAAQLRERFARQERGTSPDGSEGWLNWVVRKRAGRAVAGTVQATLTRPPGGALRAEVAWVTAVPFQGRGVASEAAGAMVAWLRAAGVEEVIAHIHPGHAASAAVARRLGLQPTGELADGEERWA